MHIIHPSKLRKACTLTIKNIGLDLFPGVAELIESIRSLFSQCSVLHRCNHSDKHIILKMIRKQRLAKHMSQKQITNDFSSFRVTGEKPNKKEEKESRAILGSNMQEELVQKFQEPRSSYFCN